ncbi:hypothetical protein ACFSR7_21510 [Cohnella sp. GCM10020058]|uniref:hypothetical protein n=1 Tax=Cohnella sp. GCM10020058 TaxID=3317330 RepID=UPI003632EA0F
MLKRYIIIITVFILVLCWVLFYFMNITINIKSESNEYSNISDPTRKSSIDSLTDGLSRTSKLEEPKEKLVKYKGLIEHIFFHPLIAYPQLAFDNDALSRGYNDYFITVSEFERIIDSLYRKNFILIRLEDVYQERKINGKLILEKKDLFLPKGKKALVISIDDLNYYPYMIENGNVSKLVLTSNGNISAYTKDKNGKESWSNDNEIIPILNDFVKLHPDFSLNGARGVICLTGYEGILGYHTQSGSPNRKSEIINAVKVVKKLKELGWSFGSHSYGHINVDKVSLQKLKEDTALWKNEVEPLVGSTHLYFYPFGSRVKYGSDKFNFLVKSGFKVISAVGPTSYTKIIDGAFTMDRRHMDGTALIQQPNSLRDLFDAGDVLDKVNRPLKYWNPTNR